MNTFVTQNSPTPRAVKNRPPLTPDSTHTHTHKKTKKLAAIGHGQHNPIVPQVPQVSRKFIGTPTTLRTLKSSPVMDHGSLLLLALQRPRGAMNYRLN